MSKDVRIPCVVQHITDRLQLTATELAEAIEAYVRSKRGVHGVTRIEFNGHRLAGPDETRLMYGGRVFVDGCTVVTYTNVERRL